MNFQAHGGRLVWKSWVLVCAAVFVLHSFTLEIDPLISQDGIQIVDYGRVMLDQSTDWALTWYVQGSIPVLPLGYPGVVLQELAFGLTSPSGLGPRYLAMLAAMLAATCIMGWLLARGTPPLVAITLASAFLLDPIFSDIYRGGRIDGWAIAACMTSCWLLRLASNRTEVGLGILSQAFFAGVMVVLSGFLWISAPILFPIVLLEYFYLLRTIGRKSDGSGVRRALRASTWIGVGGLVTFGLLVIPIIANLDAFVVSTQASYETQKFVSVIKYSIVDLYLVHSPLVFVTAVFALLVRREIGIILALALAVLLVYQTTIYLARVLYFLPYGMAIIGYACSGTPGRMKQVSLKGILQVLVLCMICFNAIQVLLIRSVVSLAQRPANSQQQFHTELERVIGRGPYRVLLKEWHLYYAGRALGWHMYQPSNPMSGEEYTRFLSTMDFVIQREHPYTNDTTSKLDAAGFELETTIPSSVSSATQVGWGYFNFTVPQKAYPNLNIYRKRDNASDALQGP